MPFGKFEFKKPEFIKVSDVIWEIPTSFKKGMRVPVRVIATKKLLDDMDLQVYDQASNVATLPGIQKYSFVMPDGHSGYGFPIGGVAAFDVNEGGVISPGGIGFDINCLHPDTKIITKYGYFKKIKDFENYEDEVLITFNLKNKDKEYSKPIFYMKRMENKILKIKTKFGIEIKVTKDHPILTPSGMVEAKDLTEGQYIAVFPFEGVEYEKPSDEIILDEEDVRKICNSKKVVNELKKRNLLPLRMNSWQLPILAKLVGYITGDGCITSYKRYGNIENWVTVVIGQEEDLHEISEDVKDLGFLPQKIISSITESKITYRDGKTRKIKGITKKLEIRAKSFAILLHALGVPKGYKSDCEFRVPIWVVKAPKWIKRLYLAGLFGAELTKPTQDKKEKYRFKEPRLSINKNENLIQNGYEFLKDIIFLLGQFDVECNKIYIYPSSITNQGTKTVKLILSISSKIENLKKLWGTIGYEYCKERQIIASHALGYLSLKSKLIEEMKKIKAALIIHESQPVTSEGSLKLAKMKVPVIKISQFLPTFEEYEQMFCESSEMIWDEIENIKEEDYNGFVYDFTVNHEGHNFVANNIILSNCGMRLVLTNLTYDEVKPHLKTLVDKLFERVPAGVGSTGFVKISKDEFKSKVITEGAHWAVEAGYGWPEDLERTELNGRADWADPSKTSSKSVERGYNQIGTLGSGNHYLEIQVVKPENIFDERLAKKWGLFPNQIVVMFHCGSRGYGHQLATDYLQKFLSVMESKYGIKILDRELACAPFYSPEGQDYYKAMGCGVNMSFANRQVILHRIREVFSEVFKQDAEKLGMYQVFDIAHNRASLEKHKVDGEIKEVLVHRKGATGSYYPGREEIPKTYRDDGSPVIIGGSMETSSCLLVGAEASKDTFCSTCHGSGRTMSRTKATKLFRGQQLFQDMLKRGIYVRSVSWSGLAEEAGAAYKNLDYVVEAVSLAGISKPVVKFVALGNVKG
jgi:tRNA-splicing ligase RtcB